MSRRSSRSRRCCAAPTLCHLDVPDIDVMWTDLPDPQAPLGARGIGEIGITGTAAAVANTVFNASGKRVRTSCCRDIAPWRAGAPRPHHRLRRTHSLTRRTIAPFGRFYLGRHLVNEWRALGESLGGSLNRRFHIPHCARLTVKGFKLLKRECGQKCSGPCTEVFRRDALRARSPRNSSRSTGATAQGV